MPCLGVVRVGSWKELPEILMPGKCYDVGGVIIRPRVEMQREEAEAIVRSMKEMVARGL